MKHLEYPQILCYTIGNEICFREEDHIPRHMYHTEFYKTFPEKAQEAQIGMYSARKKFIRYYT